MIGALCAVCATFVCLWGIYVVGVCLEWRTTSVSFFTFYLIG